MKNEDLLLKIGERVKLERTQKGLSQEKFAAKAGLNTRSISLLESGLRDIKVSTLVSIAKALDVKVGKLID